MKAILFARNTIRENSGFLISEQKDSIFVSLFLSSKVYKENFEIKLQNSCRAFVI